MTAPFSFSITISILGFFVILVWRFRETHSPVTIRKIVAPPLGMSTGLCMFLIPAFRIPWSWAFVSFALGALVLVYPILRTTNMWSDLSTRSIRIKRSPIFFFVLIVLALLRFAARAWIGQFVSTTQTAALFYLLAYGMILRWRFTMVGQFRRLSPIPTD